MKIGIIGAGSIGSLYARFWSDKGHEVMLSSRNPGKIAEAAQAIGATSGTVQEAAKFGDVILLAINYWTLDEALTAIREHVSGKLVIDATNPLEYGPDGDIQRVIPEDSLAAEVMADHLPNARIAKSLTSLWSGHIENHADLTNPTIAMPFVAAHPDDHATVAELIKDAGLVPVDLGGLAQSRPLDPPSEIWNVVLTSEEMNARLSA